MDDLVHELEASGFSVPADDALDAEHDEEPGQPPLLDCSEEEVQEHPLC